MTDKEKQSRLELSEKLLQLSQHISEAEMRQSISRMYYAAYHASAVLLDKEWAHSQIASKLSLLDENLGRDYKRLRDARSKADYTHDWIAREFASFDDFQAEFGEIMRLGSTVCERIRELTPRTRGNGDHV